MTPVSSQQPRDPATLPPSQDTSRGQATPVLPKEELDRALRALEMPFDPNLIQWRITEWSEDGTKGLMMPYADPRAYSDRLNGLFTPAGWTRKYAMQISAAVQRKNRGPAAKILVTCEASIFGVGTNSGAGEEWSDKDNAFTGAEAQAFKRALSLFGLGRYLYDIEGEWIELDRDGNPMRVPKLPRWATPRGWLAGLRPKPRKNRQVSVRTNGHVNNGFSNQSANGNGHSLVAEIESMEGKIGKRMYRGILKHVARVWSPEQIREFEVQKQVLAQMQGAERGLVRLRAAQATLAPDLVQKIVVSLNAPPAKIEDLHTLHTLVTALEKEVDLSHTQN